MTRQVQNPQGHLVKPLHAILFVLALLVFLFTLIYRMVNSESINTALATLVESLLIVSFVIFLGILCAYLIYFLHERIRKGSDRLPLGNMFVGHSPRDDSVQKPDPDAIEQEPHGEVQSKPNS